MLDEKDIRLNDVRQNDVRRTGTVPAFCHSSYVKKSFAFDRKKDVLTLEKSELATSNLSKTVSERHQDFSLHKMSSSFYANV
jgi:hypothetical protein